MIYVGGGGGAGGLLAPITILGPWAMEKLFSMIGGYGSPDPGTVRADQVMQEFPDFAISVMQQMGMDTSNMTAGGNWAENAMRAGMDPAYVMQFATSQLAGVDWSGLEQQYKDQQEQQPDDQQPDESQPDQPPDYSIDHTETGDDGPQMPDDWYGSTTPTPPVDIPSSIPTPPADSRPTAPGAGGQVGGGRRRGSGGESQPPPATITPINPPPLPPLDTWTPTTPTQPVDTTPTQPVDTAPATPEEPPSSVIPPVVVPPIDITHGDDGTGPPATTTPPVDTNPPASTGTDTPRRGGGILGMWDWITKIASSIPGLIKAIGGLGNSENPGTSLPGANGTPSPGTGGSGAVGTSAPASEYEKGILAILGPLAGALANTEAARTGKSSSSTTSTSTNTTKQNLTPQQQALMDQVSSFTSDYMTDPSKAVEPLRRPGYAAINKNYSGLPQSIADKTLAFGGQSGKFGKAIQQAEMGRMNDLSGFEGTLANTAYQGQQAAATRAAQLATQNLGSTVSGTNTSDMTGENINPGSVLAGGFAGGADALTSILLLDQLSKMGKVA